MVKVAQKRRYVGFSLFCSPSTLMQANSVLRKIKVKVSKLVIIFSPANIQTSPQKAAKRKLSEEADGDQNAETLGETSSKKLCIEDENTEKDQNNCVYQKLLGNVQKKSGCTYWKNGWRAKLCVCQKCKVWHGCLKRFRWCTFNGWDSVTGIRFLQFAVL